MRTLTLQRLLGSACAAAVAALPMAALAVETQIERATVSLPAPTQSFDPTTTVSATDRAIFGLTNGTLMQQTTSGEIVPGLAEAIDYSEDFTSATVRMRPDLTFSDGSALTAEDVAATFERHMAAGGGSLGAFVSRLSAIEVVDDLTVRFDFTGPFPSFGDFSSAGSYGIYPSDMVASEGFFGDPVTAGAYVISEGWSGNTIELVANGNYWGGTPAIGTITFTIIDDANSAVSQLQTGQIDYAGDLPPNFVTPLSGLPDVRVESVPTYGFYDIRLWNRDGPFADPDMRKAVSLAIDRAAIVRAIWGEANEPLAGFWPPVMAGYDADAAVGADLEAARALLAETDCADGCEVRMMYSDQDFPFASQLALIVQNQLAQVGIDVRLERLETAILVERLFAGDYDMVPGAMAAAANVPDHLLGNALLGTGFLKAEFSGYASEEMDAAIAQVNATSGEERLAALAEVERLFAEDQPYLTYAPWVRMAASRLPEDALSLVGTQMVVGLVDE
ncbi:ABC transporter substrate-binding protein [Wenxinia marina]|uniref:ABC-type dipeptide transport system, periplasmic component n=1 Tax=Wenxinia marina DSM 24838 TaxID=1123501 RepID=A0A0D0QG63_9RHOB|nr:ABC transporter substrate-binding protein [Wenxinia marina]KIQ71227.1 ABC-type dipeptide transport system, periplasmic component [Wenxinia marina DSM 24838]GGL81480.1 ABC transporter [Wenxinia marina]